MSEFRKSIAGKMVLASNTTDDICINVGEGKVEISQRNHNSTSIDVEKWEAYKAEIDNAIAEYQKLAKDKE